MKNSIGAHFLFIWVNLKSQLIYKGIILETYINGLFKLLLLYFVWKAIYSGQTVIAGRTFEEMVLYLILSTCISSLFIYPDIYMLSVDIRKGNIIYQLLKPISFQVMFILKNIGIILAMLSTMIPVYVAVCFIVFHKVYLPYSYILFAISIILGFLLYSTFDFLLGILCFWTENCWGLTYFKNAVVAIFSGAMIPLEYYPANVVWIIKLLPFQSIIATPVKIFTGDYNSRTILSCFGQTLIWCAIFFAIANFVYQVAKKQSTFNGG